MDQTIKFCKMHGLGNDFVIIDGVSQTLTLNSSSIKKLSDRHSGIGFDQLLLIEPSATADFFCRIFNSDGSEAEQCGNGMRCVARFLQEQKLSDKKTFSIETKSGIVSVAAHDFNNITVAMGIPQFGAAQSLSLDSQQINLLTLSIGNPHAILQVPSVKTAPVTSWGTIIATHSIFPQGTNVGFMEIINRKHIRLRTYERGAGETFACGSNSCAAVAAGIQNNLLDHKVKVELALGNLWVAWPGENQVLELIGPAEMVFSGFFNSGIEIKK